MKSFVFVALLSVCSGLQASAQTGCESNSGGTIRGIAKDAATGAPVARVNMLLPVPGCAATSASDGTFTFEHVPPGKYAVQVRSLADYRKGPLVPVTVKKNSVSTIEFLVYPANGVLDCLDAPSCAAIIRPAPASLAGLTETEKMNEVSIRMAYALTHQAEGSLSNMAICIADTSTVVLKAIRSRIPGSVPASECGMNNEKDPRNVHLIRTATGESAASYFGGRVNVIDANTFESDPSYYMNPLGAATWACRFTKKDNTWIPTTCRMTRIS